MRSGIGTRTRTLQKPSRRLRIHRVLAFAALGSGLVVSLAWGQDAPTRAGSAAIVDNSDRRCLQCHGQPHIAELNPDERLSMVGTWLGDEPQPEGSVRPQRFIRDASEPEKRPGLFLSSTALHGSVHEGVRCVECHEDASRLPHSPRLNLRSCGISCHAPQAGAFDLGSHMAAYSKGDPLAPSCVTCHGGGHEIKAISTRDAPHHRMNVSTLCGDCHRQHTPEHDEDDPASWITTYLASAHARSMQSGGLIWAANCVDCHDAHGVRSSSDPLSTVHRTHIPGTCGRCHVGVNEVFAASIHGVRLAEGHENAPVCTDCHAAHGITQASSTGFMLDVINECGRCHDSPDGEGERLGTWYRSYRESYHGQATKLGSTRAARCSDCHGAHDIRPGHDPASRVHPDHLIATCGQTGCHPGANANFVMFDPHANYRDAKNYPILFAVWLYFIVMMSSVFGFFGLHTILWFVRASRERRKNPNHSGHGKGKTAIRRFNTMNRINHALVAITFFGLTATGLPLVFAHEAWAEVMMGALGGVHVAGLWHRIFAVLLILNFVLHFASLGHSFLRRRVAWHRWLFGPESLVPRWKDAQDAGGMFRWFFRGGKLPRFDRWTYWEKFDYWAEVGGSVIIGGSGLLLWFPTIASKFLPGWVFNVAMIVHGYEALLAIGFIFTIHFFNAHLRPGIFPVDEVIFTGTMTEEEFREHRPEEYDRAVREGRLESMRVPAPDRRVRPWLVLIAAVSMGFGLLLLALIIMGGVGGLVR